MNTSYNDDQPSSTSSSSPEMWEPVLIAALSSVGTAAALAASGAYLHRLGYINSSGQSALARFSQQVGLPALFFSKMVACPTHSSKTITSPSSYSEQSSAQHLFPQEEQTINACPGIWDSLSVQHAWLIVLWPIFVVGCGLVVGLLACWLSKTPGWQRGSIIVAVTFANSTGLPTTLLSALQEHSTGPPGTASLTAFDPDPSLILSLYLIFYPVLQWGIGGFLLDKTIDSDINEESGRDFSVIHAKDDGSILSENDAEGASLVLHADPIQENSNGVSPSTELTLIHRHLDAAGYSKNDNSATSTDMETCSNGSRYPSSRKPNRSDLLDDGTLSTNGLTNVGLRAESLCLSESNHSCNGHTNSVMTHDHQHHSTCSSRCPPNSTARGCMLAVAAFLYQTVLMQPPVCGALLGLLVSSVTPLRSMFVGQIVTNSSSGTSASFASHAPLGWLLNAISSLGRAAVPINMAVLGINLSTAASSNQNTADSDTKPQQRVSYATILAVVVGKLVVLPLIGFLSIFLLLFFSSSSEGGVRLLIEAPPASALLVMMMVFLTPTSNTVMVMVDIADGLKEEMARVMAWQYVFAPFILSCTVAFAVSTAYNHGAS